MNDTRTTRTDSGAIWRFLASCKDMTARDRRNSWRATGWLFLWALGFLGTSFGIKYEVIPDGLLSYLAIGASTALGLVAVLAYARFIREADELQRKIQLEALSLGFGGGFLASFAFDLIEHTAVPTFEAPDVFLVMAGFYVIGVLLGAKRYA